MGEVSQLKREHWEDADHEVGGYVSRKDVKDFLRSALQSLLLEAERRILDKNNTDHWETHCKQVLSDMAQTK